MLAATLQNVFKPLKDLIHSRKFLAVCSPEDLDSLRADYEAAMSYDDISLIEREKISAVLHFVFENCCEVGEHKIVKDLLKSQYVDPAFRDNIFFQLACENGHFEIVECLLKDSRIDPAARDNEAIVLACSEGHDKVVKLLLGNDKIDPSVDDDFCILTAAAKGNVKIVELLLKDARVDPGAGNGAPRRVADKKGHRAVVRLLEVALRDKLHKGIADIMKGNDPWIDYDTFHPTREASLLGSGSYGSVYKAKGKKKGGVFAIKEMEIFSNSSISAFILEARMLTQINEHPNIIKQYGVYSDDRRLWIVYEYMDGGSLDSLIKEWMVRSEEKGKFSEATIRDMARQIIAGIAHLHANGIVHRDIKSDNILYNSKGEVKIADFGISTLLNAGEKISGSEAGFGTMLWKAPEQFQAGDQSYDEKVDIWAAGIVFGELARCGLPPRVINNQINEKFVRKIIHDPQPSLKALNRYSPEMQHFVRSCLTPDPDQRPSAEELLKHDFLKVRPDEAGNGAGFKLPVPPLPPVRRAASEKTPRAPVSRAASENRDSNWRPGPRRTGNGKKTVLISSIVSVVIIVGLLLFYVWYQKKRRTVPTVVYM